MGIKKIIIKKLNYWLSLSKKVKTLKRKRRFIWGRLINKKRSIISIVLINDRWINGIIKKYRINQRN